MSKKSDATTLVSHTKVDEYLPGNMTAQSKPQEWNALQFSMFSHPFYLEDGPAPPFSHHAIAFIESGHVSGEYSLNQSSWRQSELKSDNSIIVSAQTAVNWRWKPIKKENINNIMFHFPHDILTNILTNDFNQESNQVELKNKLCFRNNFLKAICLQLKAEVKNNYPYGRLFAESISQALCIYLLNHYCTVKYKNQNNSNQLYRHTLKQVLDYCHDYYNHEISLSDLATIAHLSESHFLRVFKKATGKTPTQYIIECRMERAKILLKTTALSVLAIGLEVGYNSPSHFIGLFKRYTGATPHQYRQAVQ